MKRFLTLAVLAAVLILTLPGCQLYNYDYREDVLEYAMISKDGDFSKLEEYPNLQYVDLRGSDCYDEIVAYAKAHPDVTVRYNVALGQKRFDAAAAEIILNGYEVEFDLLLKNLKYFPELQNVHLSEVTFTRQQMDELISAYPHITVNYTVELLGKSYDHTVTELDLTHLFPDDVGEAIAAISLLPQVTDVTLSGASTNSKLSVSDVKMLTDACPAVSFFYEFELFGKEINTLATELTFDSVEIGNDGVEKIREALGIMKNCTYVKLDSCGIDDSVMEHLRSDYPDITVAWRVFAGKYSILTDAEMLRMPNSLKDAQAQVLKYCTNIKYLDVQGSMITNIDFIAHMPRLECAVLSVTRIKDLSPLANCHNLIWLEVSNCNNIRDLNPISGLKNLKYLNISCTKVSDLTALNEISLERFNCVKSSVKTAALDTFIEKHPDCLTTSKGSLLGYGWRYDDKNQTLPFSYYAHMEEVFRYNDRTFKGNTKAA